MAKPRWDDTTEEELFFARIATAVRRCETMPRWQRALAVWAVENFMIVGALACAPVVALLIWLVR